MPSPRAGSPALRHRDSRTNRPHHQIERTPKVRGSGTGWPPCSTHSLYYRASVISVGRPARAPIRRESRFLLDMGAPTEALSAFSHLPQMRPSAAPRSDDRAAPIHGRRLGFGEGTGRSCCGSRGEPGPQLTDFFTRALMVASSAGVNCLSAKEVGHMAPSSRLAVSLKPNVAYLALNLAALWKKQTTLPSLVA